MLRQRFKEVKDEIQVKNSVITTLNTSMQATSERNIRQVSDRHATCEMRNNTSLYHYQLCLDTLKFLSFD